MKEFWNKNINWFSKASITLVLISSLFLFWNLTTDLYDTPKFLIFLLITGILTVLLSIRFILLSKVTIVRTPLDIPLLLLAAVAIASTFFSSSPYVSILGNQLKVSSSLVFLLSSILFYFVLVNSLKNVKDIKWIIYIITLASGFLSLITILAYAGIKLLPPPWVHGINFTPTGSSFTTTAILALLIPFVVTNLINATKVQNLILNSVLLTLFGLTIALTGSFPTWIAAFAALLLTLTSNRFFEKLNIKNLKSIVFQTIVICLIIPLVITALFSILSLIPPLGKAQNPLYNQAKNFPREIQLPFNMSWKIAASSFRDAPFWGSGPSTFLFDFTNYKTIDFNSSNFWNLRFDSAFNEYLQVLATLGGIGILALLSLTALFITSAFPILLAKNPLENDRLALAISGLVFFIILALHASNLVLWIFGLFILAAFLSAKESINTPNHSSGNNIKNMLLNIAGSVSPSNYTTQTFRIEALPSVLLVITLAIFIFVFYFAGKLTYADFHHRKAINAISTNQGIVAYNELVAAAKLNPYSDNYRTDLAQTNFALANAIAAAKGPTESSPSGSLTDQDKQNIQVLLQQSINEARAATALSPKSALNWEILGLLYRQIAGVAQNALVFSLDSYGKAIFQDPLNPNLRLSVGGVYYAVRGYDLAIRFFTDAINLKPDFANAYYNLSVALKDKGDLVNAKAAAERILTLVTADSQDYKTASAYLVELNKKISEGSTEKSTTIPPASETTGALKDEKLPKVVDVGTPPSKIATPAAVVKPSPSPSPSASSTPSPSPSANP